MKIKNQSAHDGTCDTKCERLTWDRNSYIGVNGARAVKLGSSPSGAKLMYQQASNRTLAITHVWSHGQGGRPEEGYGLNLCLHQRYKAIAESLGYDSYWMDTTCIPEDHGLRREAIMKINEVFEKSRVTLVCDRDIMSIDATEPSIPIYGTILVTIMVCDWNLRAWTFLEAFRARGKIHVLCTENKTIPVKDIVDTIYRKDQLILPYLSQQSLISYQENTGRGLLKQFHVAKGIMNLVSCLLKPVPVFSAFEKPPDLAMISSYGAYCWVTKYTPTSKRSGRANKEM